MMGTNPIGGKPASDTSETTGTLAAPRELRIRTVPIDRLKTGNRKLRRRTPKTQQKLVRSLERFGMVSPVIIDEHNHIIDGEGLVEAARELGLSEVPAVIVDHLTKTELKALRIALNRLQELAEWDETVLADEFRSILELDSGFELEVTGFELGEIDYHLSLDDGSAHPGDTVAEDELPEMSSESAISRPGDRFIVDSHILHCGDALSEDSYRAALGGLVADCVFTDPPYNVAIDGHVSGLGSARHREFAMASGEMSSAEFARFLEDSIANIVKACRDGAVVYVCMDWRSIDKVIAAIRSTGLELLNLCIWVKSNGGMGSFYRSRHEEVVVARKGKTPHLNNVELGKHGRYRTNVWEYAGLNAFGSDRDELLHAHPTVKPVTMVRDAILDCTKRHDLVLDPFGGSGTTMLAAEKAGRRACLIELDPVYVDLTLRRFEQHYGIEAVHEATGLTFSELAVQRRAEAATQAETPPDTDIDTGTGTEGTAQDPSAPSPEARIRHRPARPGRLRRRKTPLNKDAA